MRAMFRIQYDAIRCKPSIFYLLTKRSFNMISNKGCNSQQVDCLLMFKTGFNLCWESSLNDRGIVITENNLYPAVSQQPNWFRLTSVDGATSASDHLICSCCGGCCCCFIPFWISTSKLPEGQSLVWICTFGDLHIQCFHLDCMTSV